MADITLMVTCIGGGLSAQMIRLLKRSSRHNVRVVGVDMSQEPVARHFADVFEVVPGGDDPGYVDAILAVCAQHGVDLIFPGADEEVLALARHKSAFASLGVTIACNDSQINDLITNKLSTYEWLSRGGFTMPVWKSAASFDALVAELDAVLDQCGEAVVKSPSERGGRGIFVIGPRAKDIEERPGSKELHANRDAFLDGPARALKFGEPLLVMERLRDPVHDLDVLAWQGDALTLIPRRRRSSSAPNEGHLIIDAPKLIEVGRKVVSALRLSWLFDIDVMMNADGEPIILEINPRASGSVAVGMAAGVPLMDDLISLALGELVAPRDVPVGTRVVAYGALEAFQ